MPTHHTHFYRTLIYLARQRVGTSLPSSLINYHVPLLLSLFYPLTLVLTLGAGIYF
jgi:hypothetical protein